jgi:hypothetical protein
MLCVNKYPQDYLDRCRSRVKQQLGVYRDLMAATTGRDKTKNPKIGAAVESFEPVFFNNMAWCWIVTSFIGVGPWKARTATRSTKFGFSVIRS